MFPSHSTFHWIVLSPFIVFHILINFNVCNLEEASVNPSSLCISVEDFIWKKYIFLLFLCNFFRLSSWPIDVWLQGKLRWVKCIFWNLFHFPHTISELQPCAENRMILIKKYFHFIKPKAPKIKFDPTSKLWVVFEGMCAKNDKLSIFLGYYEKNGINFLKQFLFRCFQPVGLFLTDTGRVLLLV